MKSQDQISTVTSEKIIQINEARVKDQLAEVVHGMAEETLNSMLDAEADTFCKAGKHEQWQIARITDLDVIIAILKPEQVK